MAIQHISADCTACALEELFFAVVVVVADDIVGIDESQFQRDIIQHLFQLVRRQMSGLEIYVCIFFSYKCFM